MAAGEHELPLGDDPRHEKLLNILRDTGTSLDMSQEAADAIEAERARADSAEARLAAFVRTARELAQAYDNWEDALRESSGYLWAGEEAEKNLRQAEAGFSNALSDTGAIVESHDDRMRDEGRRAALETVQSLIRHSLRLIDTQAKDSRAAVFAHSTLTRAFGFFREEVAALQGRIGAGKSAPAEVEDRSPGRPGP
jgi:hypothetical protein